MNDLTLDDLLNRMSAEAGLSKSASEEDKDAEQKEKDKEKEVKKDVDCMDKDVKDAKKNIQKAEEDNEAEERTKEAAAAGAVLAKEVMQKVASIKLDQVKTEDTMNKQAAEAGKALADALLEKLASVGDENTSNGIAGGVPNKTQVDLAAQVAEQDRVIQNQPGTDGRGNGGTVNQIFDAIVADAMAQGAAPIDQNPAPGVSKDEGDRNFNQAPNQVGTGAYTVADDEVEKAAAVSVLVEQGFDFLDAVNLVKEAADQIEQEEEAQIKQAAFEQFLDAGFDFDQAVELTKVASLAGMATRAGRKTAVAAGRAGQAAERASNGVKFDAARVGGQVRGAVSNSGEARKNYLKALGNNKAVQVGAGAAAVGAAGTAAAIRHEKKAALDLLLGNGIDFDQAVELVNQKASQLYGY